MLLSSLSANSGAGTPGALLSFLSANSTAGTPGALLSFVGTNSLARTPGVILSFAGASSLGALGVLFRFVGFNFLAAPGRALPRQVEPPLVG